MHKNNFDFLRLLFASFVIITHTYILTGKSECDWLCQITSGQLLFSYVGVKGFFVISGFLIFQSLNRSKELKDYYWKRVLRLFPALIAVLILTVLLVPFVYENNKVSFLHNKQVWTYIPTNLTLYKKQYGISGVFETNPFKGAINGSLWTISYEFTFYILLSTLFYVKSKVSLTQSILVITYIAFLVCNIFFMGQLGKYWHILSSAYVLELGLYFTAGSVLAAIRIDKFKYINSIFFSSLVLLVISVVFNFYGTANLVLFPLIIIIFGLKSTTLLNNIGNTIGDLSYGLYIYAFPVEQTLIHYFNFKSLGLLMFLSFIISLALAFLSWHLIESKALKLKSIHPGTFFKRLIPGFISTNQRK